MKRGRKIAAGLAIVALAGMLATAALGVINPAYQLGPGPFTVEDLGSPLQANSQEHQIMFRDGSNQLHLLLYYTVAEIWKYPLQVLDINLDSGSYRLVDGVLGRPGPNGTVYDPVRQKVFLGSGDPGYFMEYDLATGAVTNLGKLAQKGLQYGEFGDAGWLYLGESVWAGLERYHPGTGVRENFGDLDPANHNSYYSYTVGADTNFAYVGIGQMPWYLAVVNLQTGGVTLHWKADNDTGGTVGKAVNGGWYYQRSTTAGNKWYRLENGTPSEIPAAQVPALIPWYKRGNVISGATYFPSEFGVEVNLDQAYPDSGNGNIAVIRWRSVGSNTWQSLTVSGFRIRPVTLKRLYPWAGSVMMGFTDFYGPVFTYDTASKTLTTLGRTQYSNYDALFYATNDIFISGYTAATVRYDPTRPWTLGATVPDRYDTSLNPYKIPLSIGKYHYYMARGANGLLYQACHHERSATGGEVGWYNPADNTAGGRLRDPFLEYDVRDLKAVLNGTKLVYSSTSNKLFVIDTASNTVEREIVPILGVGPLDKVVETDPGVIAGVVGTNFYTVDVVTGGLLLVTNLPAAAFGTIRVYDRRLTLGPDGYIWIYLGSALYRIHPDNGGAQKIFDDTGSFSTVFQGDDLLLHGGTNIRRIRNLFGGGEPEPVKIHYVSLSGTNLFPPYTSWDLATPNLQAAIDEAAAGDMVLVAAGTYWIGSAVGITNAITVRSVSGAAGTIVARAAAGTNQPHHRIFSITADAVLDGFTVRNGYLPVVPEPAVSEGGGIYMSAGTVQNCVISSNTLGSFWTSHGGGVCLAGGTLQFCTIVSNSVGAAGSGGGVFQTRKTAQTSSLLYSNTIAFNNGNGGGLYMVGGESGFAAAGTAVAQLNLIESNTGGVGGGVYITSYYNARVSNCLIRFNTASQGGGVYFINGPNTLEACAIVSNTATTSGGGMQGACNYGAMNFRRCVFSANTNANFPGIYLTAGDVQGDGNVNFDLCRITDNRGWRSVYLGGSPAPVRFRNSTIASGQGVGVEAAAFVTNTAGAFVYPVFLNTIVYNHATNLYSTNAGVLTGMLMNSFLNSCSPQLTAAGFNNVTADPQFVAAASGIYRLKSTSPCAKTGTTNVFSLYQSDIEWAPYGQTLNMGCYEYLPKSAGVLIMIIR